MDYILANILFFPLRNNTEGGPESLFPRTDASNTYCKREIFDFGAFPKQSVTQTQDCPMAFGSPFELEGHGWK
ncbi:MAG: hypothetical protein IJ584_06720, partial [Bacteroidales bacterium]|nr:hypothetical protein [Bacteroidales bacterium]